jgi:hypothetical protein
MRGRGRGEDEASPTPSSSSMCAPTAPHPAHDRLDLGGEAARRWPPPLIVPSATLCGDGAEERSRPAIGKKVRPGLARRGAGIAGADLDAPI